MSAPVPTGERRAAGTSGCHRLLHRSWPEEVSVPGSRHYPNEWATRDLPEECRFLLNTQLMFLKKEKDPTSKQFDDDEWLRSLTAGQEATTDIPQDSVSYDQQDVDPEKVRTIHMGEFSRTYVSRRLLALSEGEIAALTTSMRQIGVGTPGGAEALAIFHQLFHDGWVTGTAGQNQSRLPPTSAHLTVMSKQRRSCMFRRQPRRQTKLGSKHWRAARTGRRKPDHRIP